MEEFRDDVSRQFIQNFKNYKTKGFEEVGWRGYLEEMIATDKHDVYVTIMPPSSFLKSNNFAPNANIRVQYTVSLGIAHMYHFYYKPNKIFHS